MNSNRPLAVVLATVMVVAVLAPFGTVAADATPATNVDDGLAVDVEQNDDVIVSVTANDTPVENASVDVTTVDNVSYAGVGDYETDGDGTVVLPTPNETVLVNVTATAENATASEIVELAGPADDRPFGQLVSEFVHELQEERADDGLDRPFGQYVAAFATGENPGNATGPPAHAGPGDGNESDAGPPAHAGPGDDNESDAGPPAHAGPGDDNESDVDDEQGPPAHAGSGDDGNESDADDERGPPAHAGPSDDERGPPGS